MTAFRFSYYVDYLGSPPGVTGFAGGRPKATDIVGYWPALLDKTQVKTKVRVEVS